MPLPEFETFAADVGRYLRVEIPSPCPSDLALAADLALDSLQLVELIDELEERYGVLADESSIIVGSIGELYNAFQG